MNSFMEAFDTVFSAKLAKTKLERRTTEMISRHMKSVKDKELQGPKQALMTMMNALSSESSKLQLRQGEGKPTVNLAKARSNSKKSILENYFPACR